MSSPTSAGDQMNPKKELQEYLNVVKADWYKNLRNSLTFSDGVIYYYLQGSKRVLITYNFKRGVG